MITYLTLLPVLVAFSVVPASVETDGDLEIVPITHASLVFKWGGRVVYVDPWSQGDYTGQPAADLILVTDVHGDHLDRAQIAQSSKPETVILGPPAVQEQVAQAQVIRNGETTDILGIGVEAVPMYNLVRGPSEGRLYHTKGRGNGYVLTFGERRVYISGDTECVPEMKGLRNIDIAFVCMNLPYTMPPEEAAECVNEFRPRVVYPYHYRDSDLQIFKSNVDPEIEVRVLDWYPAAQ